MRESTEAGSAAAARRAEPRLRHLFAGEFAVGAAVNARTIETHEELLAHHFGSVTAENEMKFERVHPKPDAYTFEEADRIADFARRHGMRLRGHTLVWHNQTPDWLFERPGGGLIDKTELYARLKEHIDTVVGRYKGEIYAWDVVNEAVADGGDAPLRESKWLAIAGEDFIARAFELAHDADPDAQLYYNDYNETDPVKRDRIYDLVRSLVERGAPIHGVGLQAHWNLYSPSLDEIRAAIEKYASLGLRLQVTELDVSMYGAEDRGPGVPEPTEEMKERLAERYGDLFRLLREYVDVIDAVTFWGAADDATWLDYFPVRNRKNWPLLFDERQMPKLAYWRVAEAALQGRAPSRRD